MSCRTAARFINPVSQLNPQPVPAVPVQQQQSYISRDYHVRGYESSSGKPSSLLGTYIFVVSIWEKGVVVVTFSLYVREQKKRQQQKIERTICKK